MPKFICVLCKLIIRRPVDHVHCPGACNSSYLQQYKPKVSTTEITKEFKIPEQWSIDK